MRGSGQRGVEQVGCRDPRARDDGAAGYVELDTSNDAEVEAVFRLPPDILAKVGDGIESGRWASRDAFARITFAEAISTHATKRIGDGKPVSGTAGRRRLEGARRNATVRG